MSRPGRQRAATLARSAEAGWSSAREASRHGTRPNRNERQATVQNGFRDRVSLISKVANQLRGDYKPYDYAKVILPLVVLRRLDCVLAATKARVLATAAELEGKVSNMEPSLLRASGQSFYNTSKLDFTKLLDDPAHIAAHLRQYIAGFSPGAAEVMTRFGFDSQIAKMDEADLLYRIIGMFANVDLHPESVSNHEMGYIFEELIRGFSEQSNETAGEHFTPREVIRLMVSLLFVGDDPASWANGTIKTLYDPTCGTGGMLSVAEDFLRDLNHGVRLEVFGQEVNDESYAICRSDMMIKGQDPSHIHVGNTLTKDGESDRKFDYMLSNPPFGVEWKKVEAEVRKEATTQGFDGRFGAGLPRINDGSFLFLQHMISKMKPVDEGGSRIAIVFNGSPLFAGDAGSGESEIRRWIIENDWLEAIVALPDQLFYNTGISTYFWIVTNRKSSVRKGKVQLLDIRDMGTKMRRSLGEKRKEIPLPKIEAATELYGCFQDNEFSKILPNESFSFCRLPVERPLRLRYEASPETVHRLDDRPDFVKLSDEDQTRIRTSIEALVGFSTTDPREIRERVEGTSKKAEKVLWDVISTRDVGAPPVTDGKGRRQADPWLRDWETVPLPLPVVEFRPDARPRLASDAVRNVIDQFLATRVLPHRPDAWADYSRVKLGYEIPVTRIFFRYTPPRPVADIDAEIEMLEDEIRDLLKESVP
jgi:type I restriction enzyme M protein